MKTSIVGLDLIKEFEGFSVTAYRCPAGVWTNGYGFTKGVKEGDKMTRAQANMRLAEELVEYEQAVLKACTVPPTQHQFDALVSCAWNIGVGGIAKSSMIKAHNRRDFAAAAKAFGLWNKAGGKVFAGLVRRRAAEAALYMAPVALPIASGLGIPTNPMPQSVDPERPMTQSRIVQASTVAGGTAVLATASETIKVVNDIKSGMGELNEWLVPILLLVTIAAVGWTLYERFKQRRAGVA